MTNVVEFRGGKGAETPDEEFIRRDANGREAYCFLGQYRMDGSLYSTHIWAYDWAEAERMAAAMGNVTISGQLYGAVPA